MLNKYQTVYYLVSRPKNLEFSSNTHLKFSYLCHFQKNDCMIFCFSVQWHTVRPLHKAHSYKPNLCYFFAALF